MNDTRKTIVITDARGAIVGAGHFDPIRADDGEVAVRVRPGKGQRLLEVAADDIGPLASEADFRRLVAEYHLPRGKTALVRRRGSRTSSQRPDRRR
jgi:hypothetical protein